MDLDDYIWLTGHEAADWLLDLARDNRPLHQQLARLRKQLTGARARLVVQQAGLRRRAAEKFGPWGKQMFFTDIGLQQATDRWIAAHKAARFPQAVSVHDLCCGIGGDLLGLATRGERTGGNPSATNRSKGSRTIGWDLSERMVLLAGANLRIVLGENGGELAEVRTGDVERLRLPSGAMWHLDPDRRPQQQRSTHVALHCPGPTVVNRLRQTHPQGAVKLAPACQVPKDWAKSAELEWISRGRECRQLVAWFGHLATSPGRRRATVLSHCPTHAPVLGDQESGSPPTDALVSHSLVGEADRPLATAQALGRYLLDPDPAVLAARLLGELARQHDLSSLVPGGAYLTADHPVDDPLLACFEVLEQFPLRVKPLAKFLASRDIGNLEVKKRGIDLDPSVLRRQLKLRGTQSATLLLARLGQREVAILAKRRVTTGAARL